MKKSDRPDRPEKRPEDKSKSPGITGGFDDIYAVDGTEEDSEAEDIIEIQDEDEKVRRANTVKPKHDE